jgi:hypothetical protein
MKGNAEVEEALLARWTLNVQVTSFFHRYVIRIFALFPRTGMFVVAGAM